MNIMRVNAEERFLGKLAGVSDPETKRKIIGEEFIRVFEEEAKKIGEIDYLVQGTIYPDVVESGTRNFSYNKITSQCWRTSRRYGILTNRTIKRII